MILLSLVLFLLSEAIKAAGTAPVNYQDGVEFFYQEAGVKSVAVAGDFNGWSKTKDLMVFDTETSMFRLKLPLAEGEYTYKFVIDNSRWIKDPAAEKSASDGYGGENSIVTVIRPAKSDFEKTLASIGPKAGNILFRYKNTAAKTVSVAGAFNQWRHDRDFLVNENGDGEWVLKMYLPPGKYTYFFVVNGSEWRKDPAASEFSDDGFGGKNSVITVEGK